MKFKRLNENTYYGLDKIKDPILFSTDGLDNETIKVLRYLDHEGYDANAKDVRNYADAVAEYIDMVRSTGEDYSVADWYRDTTENYPEELSDLSIRDYDYNDQRQLESLKEDIDFVGNRDNKSFFIDEVHKYMNSHKNSAKESDIRKIAVKMGVSGKLVDNLIYGFKIDRDYKFINEDYYSENDVDVIVDRLSSVYVQPDGQVTQKDYNKIYSYLNKNYPEVKDEIIDRLVTEYGLPSLTEDSDYGSRTNLVFATIKNYKPITYISKEIYQYKDPDYLFTTEDNKKALFDRYTYKQDIQELLDEYTDGYSLKDFGIYAHFYEGLNEDLLTESKNDGIKKI